MKKLLLLFIAVIMLTACSEKCVVVEIQQKIPAQNPDTFYTYKVFVIDDAYINCIETSNRYAVGDTIMACFP